MDVWSFLAGLLTERVGESNEQYTSRKSTCVFLDYLHVKNQQ